MEENENRKNTESLESMISPSSLLLEREEVQLWVTAHRPGARKITHIKVDQMWANKFYSETERILKCKKFML